MRHAACLTSELLARLRRSIGCAPSGPLCASTGSRPRARLERCPAQGRWSRRRILAFCLPRARWSHPQLHDREPGGSGSSETRRGLMNVVCVGAHQDDEMHCLGTLIKYANRGDHIVIAAISNGDKGGQYDPSIPHGEIARIRAEESGGVARALGGSYTCLAGGRVRRGHAPGPRLGDAVLRREKATWSSPARSPTTTPTTISRARLSITPSCDHGA